MLIPPSMVVWAKDDDWYIAVSQQRRPHAYGCDHLGLLVSMSVPAGKNEKRSRIVQFLYCSRYVLGDACVYFVVCYSMV